MSYPHYQFLMVIYTISGVFGRECFQEEVHPPDTTSRSRPLTLQNTIDKEGIIEIGHKSFIEVGMALTQIRDAKLYRKDYKTFEEYCKERWEFTANYAHRLIQSSAIIENLKSVPTGTIPTSEAQTRPFTHLEPEQQQVWQKAVETTPEGNELF